MHKADSANLRPVFLDSGIPFIRVNGESKKIIEKLSSMSQAASILSEIICAAKIVGNPVDNLTLTCRSILL